MPIYEYRCEHCDDEFEELVSSGTPDSQVECPACGRQGSARRKLSAFAVSGSHTLGSVGASALSGCGPGASSGFS